MAVLGALLAGIQAFSTTARYHFPLPLVAGWVIAGAVVGGGLGAWAAERQLRFLERKGRVKTSLSTILFLFGGVIVFFAIFLFLVNNMPVEVIASITVFLSPMPAAFFAVDSVLFFNWERRHKRKVFSGTWRSLYVYPPLEQQPQSQAMRGQ